MCINENLKKIKSKERDIQDLANFLTNRPEKTQSLYCMLLGAGASVTSGIRTGQELIHLWKEEIIKKYYPDFDFKSKPNDEIQKNLKECINNYDENNEYSSLFGKIYDLPTQRRNFIEQEVAKADSPSIGYQYLNLLAQKKYIETFFTTNFDDLLELSLNPLTTKERPIVCAQDSSISNISITSPRTKIIKLHGDFLYNNLKSASEETKDLKTNMKTKFKEFLKNYGLIVLGYAGNDNSIMDLLNELLDSNEEEYLNNGLYWCIRKTDYQNGNISKSVIDILDKKKVFYILIDGFDEFCAELTHKIYEKTEKEDILLSKTQEQQFQELEKYYNKQKEKFSENLLIVNDIKNSLSNEPQSENNFSDIGNKNTNDLSYTQKSDDNNDTQNIIDNALSKDIRKLMHNKEYDKAISLLDKELENNIPSFLYNFYATLKFECLYLSKNITEARKTIEETIKYNQIHKKDSNVQLYMNKSIIEKRHEDKIEAIKDAIKIEPYDYNLFNRLAAEIIEAYNLNINEYKSQILDYYEKSIFLNNNSDNDAYIDRIEFLKDCGEDDDSQTLISICDKTINLLKNKDPFSFVSFKAEIEKINCKIKPTKGNDKNELYKDAENIFKNFINNNKVYERNISYVDLYLNFCSKNNYISNSNLLFEQFDPLYDDSIIYKVRKAKIYLSNYRNLYEAISLLENIDESLLKYSKRDRDLYYSTYIRYLLYSNKYEKAYKIFNEHVFQNMRNSKLLEADVLYNIDQNKFLDFIIKEFNESDKETSDYISYTYNLLRIGYYDEIYELCQKVFNDSNTIIDINNPVLRINYNLAKKLGPKTSKITKSNLESVFQLKENPIEKVAGYLLIDEPQKAEELFKNEIQKDYENYYSFMNMPVFQSLNFNKLKLAPIDFDNSAKEIKNYK